MQHIRQSYSRITGHIVWIGVGLGLFIWVLDAIVDAVVINQGSFVSRLFPLAYPEELSDRAQVLALLIIVSGYIRAIASRRQQLADANEALQAEIAERGRAEEALRRSEERLRVLVGNISDTIAVVDRNGTIRFLSRSAKGALGRQTEQLVGSDAFTLVHPDDAARARDLFTEVLAGPRVTRSTEVRVHHADGTWHYVEATGSNLLDDPSVGGIVATYRDITERKRAEEALRFLAEASRVLAASLDYEATLPDLARLAVPLLGDWCVIDEIEEQGRARRVATAHADPAKAALVEELRRYRLDLDAPEPVSRALATGKPVCGPGNCHASFLVGADDTEHLDLMRRLDPQSCMFVPLVAHGRALGAITVAVAEGQRRYDQVDLALAEELAHLAALEIANAQLYRAERRARQSVERAAERASRLQAVSAALSEGFTSDQVAQVIVAQSMSTLGANAGMVALLTSPGAEGAELQVLHSVGYPPQVAGAQRRIPIATPTPIADAVRSGEPVLLASRAARTGHAPQSGTAEPSTDAVAALPLAVEGRTVGGLSLTFGATREFSADDRALMLSLARLGAQALERARLYEAERRARGRAEVAQQRSALLARVSQVFSEASPDLHQALDSVIKEIAETLGDGCSIRLLSDDGQWLAPAVSYHPDPVARTFLREMQAATLQGAREGLVGRMAQPGQSLLIPQVQPEQLRTMVKPEYLRYAQRFRVHSFLIVPLRVHGRITGTLTAVRDQTAAAYTPGDQHFLQDLANRVALAVENGRLYQQLAERERRLQDLVHRLLVAQEEERRHVAYEIHDGLAQLAAATHQHLQGFAQLYRPRSPRSREGLDRVLALARGMVREARRVIANLRPTVLDDFGLAAAIRLQVEELRADGWQVAYHEAAGDERFPPAVETALFRVAQEALTNVRKHAQTDRVAITLERRGKAVRLTVADAGRGFEMDAVQQETTSSERVGLAGMYERLAWLGGRCTVESRPGIGTRVVADVPLPADADGERGEDADAIEQWPAPYDQGAAAGAPGADVPLPADAGRERGEGASEEGPGTGDQGVAAGASGTPHR